MNTACPHCNHDLAHLRVTPPRRRNAILAGDATLQCPQCGGGLVLNVHPGEGELPFGLELELAVYLVLGAALALAAILAPVLPPWLTFAAVVFACVTGAISQRAYFYGVTLAKWPRYRAAAFRFIAQVQPGARI